MRMATHLFIHEKGGATLDILSVRMATHLFVMRKYRRLALDILIDKKCDEFVINENGDAFFNQ